MSNPQNEEADDLEPTVNEGYKPGQKKSVDEYAKLDAGDESLARWKASLGISADASAAPADGPRLTLLSLFLSSPSLPDGKTVSIDLTKSESLESLKKNPITIKEGVEYSVGITFKINNDVISGLRYLHVVKRAGVKVDKLEQMIGSYGPRAEQYSSTFHSEESPSGMIARSGTYTVRSRVLDDDKEVFADFEWAFKLAKEW